MKRKVRAVVLRILRRGVERFLIGALYLGGLLILWQLAVDVFHAPSWLVPAPRDVIRSLGSLPWYYARHTGFTASAAGLGLLFGGVCGVVLGAALQSSRTVSRLVTPLLLAVGTFPIVAIGPLLTTLMGYGLAPKVFIAGLLSWLPIVFNTARGLAATPADVQAFARVISMNRVQRLRLIQVPYALPYITTGLNVAAPWAVLGAVVGEFAGNYGNGLATVILGAGSDFGVERVYACLVLLSLLGGLFYLATMAVDRWARAACGASIDDTLGGRRL